jgi:hypothetical protein
MELSLLEHKKFRDSWVQIDALGIWKTKVIFGAD